MPVWKTLSPRLVDHLRPVRQREDGAQIQRNRYQLSATNGVAAASTRCGCSRPRSAGRDLNGDDVAQGRRAAPICTAGCEMNFAQLPANFGLITPGCTTVYRARRRSAMRHRPGRPQHQARHEWAYNVGIQHELLPRFSVTANYFYTQFYNLRQRTTCCRRFADYTPVQVASPLDGSVVTIYNVSAAKQSAVQNLQTSSDTAKLWNTDFEFGFNARLPRGASVFGGTATDRTIATQCDITDDPNRLNYCDQTKSGIPLNTQFKIAGSSPLPWGIQVGASFQTYEYLFGSGAPTTTFTGGGVWQITRTTQYPADCMGPCTPGGLVNPNQTVATVERPAGRARDHVL